MYKLYAQWCNHIHWKKQDDQEISNIFLQISEKYSVYNASKKNLDHSCFDLWKR